MPPCGWAPWHAGCFLHKGGEAWLPSRSPGLLPVVWLCFPSQERFATSDSHSRSAKTPVLLASKQARGLEPKGGPGARFGPQLSSGGYAQLKISFKRMCQCLKIRSFHMKNLLYRKVVGYFPPAHGNHGVEIFLLKEQEDWPAGPAFPHGSHPHAAIGRDSVRAGC